MATLTKLVIGIILSFLLFSCNFMTGLEGNRNVTSENRETNSTFNKIDAGHGLNVIIKEGSQQSVVVEADENLQQHILIRVNDNTLFIETDTNIGTAKSKTVKVTYTDLYGLDINSGANLSSMGVINSKDLEIDTTSGGNANLEVTCNTLKAKATSGGTLKLMGNASKFDAKATTGGNFSADELIAVSVKAKATTGGNLRVHAKEAISASSSTGGNVSYSGNPEKLNISDGNTTGGSITKS